MILKILKYLFKDFYIFSAAYSNNVFPDPLEKDFSIEEINDMPTLSDFVEENTG